MGVLTKYDQIEPIYLPQSVVTYLFTPCICILGAVYTIFLKNKIDTIINICFILLLTLHVSALILGHHQAYNTSPSS
jgi:hypothetical protein